MTQVSRLDFLKIVPALATVFFCAVGNAVEVNGCFKVDFEWGTDTVQTVYCFERRGATTVNGSELVMAFMGFVGAEPQLEPGNCVRAKSSGVSTIAGHETFSFAAVDGSHEYVVKSTAPTGERFGKMSVKDLKGSATGKAMAFEEMTAAEVTEWKKPLALYTDRDLELTCSQTVIK